MPQGLYVPVVNSTDITSIDILNGELASTVSSYLRAGQVTQHRFPQYGFVLLSDAAADDKGLAVNSRATDLLWRTCRQLYLGSLVQGPALIVGVDTELRLCNAPGLDMLAPLDSSIDTSRRLRAV